MRFYEFLEKQKQLNNYNEEDEVLYSINTYELDCDKYTSKQIDFLLDHFGQKNYKSKNVETKKQLLGAFYK